MTHVAGWACAVKDLHEVDGRPGCQGDPECSCVADVVHHPVLAVLDFTGQPGPAFQHTPDK